MTRRGREADGPAPDAGGDAARAPASAAGRPVPAPRAGRDARHAGIARRQRHRIRVRVRGRLGQTIRFAGELYVSFNTVKTHVRSLYAKLGTHRRAETVTRARNLGLLAPLARSAR